MKTNNDCTGCLACYNICPKNAIKVSQSVDGFYRPVIDSLSCIHCGLCDKVCDSIFKKKSNYPQNGFVFSNNDSDILDKSSSGGAFYALASYVLSLGGVVFAAAFSNDNSVQHIKIEDITDLFKAMRSKYVQSFIGDSFKNVKNELAKGRYVLFCGTPCQVSGLKAIIKDNSKLFLIDFICHGVPSPLIFKEHMETISCGRIVKQNSINFRDKRNGLSNFGLSFEFENDTSYYSDNQNDKYLIAFSNNHFLQPSCYKCKFKTIECDSDVTISDLWGKRGFCDKYSEFERKDCSCLIANSSKGMKLIKAIKEYGMMQQFDFCEEFKINASRFFSSSRPKKNVPFCSDARCFLNKESIFIRFKRKTIVYLNILSLKRRLGK